MRALCLPRSFPPVPALAALSAYALVVLTVGIPCPFHAFTGMYCPGCGGTRAVKALLHGRLGLAVHDNAWFVLVAGPALLIYGFVYCAKTARLEMPARVLLNLAAWSGILFFIARNVPTFPFTLLRPLP